MHLVILVDPLTALISFINFIFRNSSFSCFDRSFFNKLFSLIHHILNSLTISIILSLIQISFLLAIVINQWLNIFVRSVLCPCILCLCMIKFIRCTLIIWSFIHLFLIIIFQFAFLFSLFALQNLLIFYKHFSIILQFIIRKILSLWTYTQLLTRISDTLFGIESLPIILGKILIFLLWYMLPIQFFGRIPPQRHFLMIK